MREREIGYLAFFQNTDLNFLQALLPSWDKSQEFGIFKEKMDYLKKLQPASRVEFFIPAFKYKHCKETNLNSASV